MSALKCTATQANGSQKIIYTNYVSQVLLTDFWDTPGEQSAGRWITYTYYDPAGAVPMATYSPAAINMSGSPPPYNDTAAGLNVQLSTDAGLVTTSTYTSVTVGGDSYPNYLASQSVQEGTGGTPSLVQEYTYGGQAATGSTAALVYTATSTTYVDGTTATAVITTYGPTFYTDTAQV